LINIWIKPDRDLGRGKPIHIIGDIMDNGQVRLHAAQGSTDRPITGHFAFGCTDSRAEALGYIGSEALILKLLSPYWVIQDFMQHRE